MHSYHGIEASTTIYPVPAIISEISCSRVLQLPFAFLRGHFYYLKGSPCPELHPGTGERWYHTYTSSLNCDLVFQIHCWSGGFKDCEISSTMSMTCTLYHNNIIYWKYIQVFKVNKKNLRQLYMHIR